MKFVLKTCYIRLSFASKVKAMLLSIVTVSVILICLVYCYSKPNIFQSSNTNHQAEDAWACVSVKTTHKVSKKNDANYIPLFSLFLTLNPSFNELSIFIFDAEPVASIYSKCWLVVITVYIYCSDLGSSLAFSSFMWGFDNA